jgi:hypothetical protein
MFAKFISELADVLSICGYIAIFEALLSKKKKQIIANHIRYFTTSTEGFRKRISSATRATGETLDILFELSCRGIGRMAIAGLVGALVILVASYHTDPIWRLTVHLALEGRIGGILPIISATLLFIAFLAFGIITHYLLPVLIHARGMLAIPVFLFSAIMLAFVVPIIIITPAYLASASIQARAPFFLPLQIHVLPGGTDRATPSRIFVKRATTTQEVFILNKLRMQKTTFVSAKGERSPLDLNYRIIADVLEATPDDLFLEVEATGDLNRYCGPELAWIAADILNIANTAMFIEGGTPKLDCSLLKAGPISTNITLVLRLPTWMRIAAHVPVLHVGHYGFRENWDTDGIAIVAEIFIKRSPIEKAATDYKAVKRLFDKREFDPIFASLTHAGAILAPLHAYIPLVIPTLTIGLLIFFLSTKVAASLVLRFSQTWLYSSIPRAPLVAFAAFLGLLSIPLLLIRAILF